MEKTTIIDYPEMGINHLTKSFSTSMNNDSDTYICDCPTSGMFRVMHRGSCVAIFNYCGEDESGFFTKKQAKKLANKLARKIENSTTIKTKKGFKLLKRERNNNDQR